VSYRPDLAALPVDSARVAALPDAVYRVALVDLLEVRILVGAVFGDGGRVVGSGPAGCWLPTSARTIDSNGTTVPTGACPCCGAMMWGLAGSGWCCRRCHPDPRLAQAERDSELRGTKSQRRFPDEANGVPAVAGRP
jgi:hypothetical protein